MFDISVILCPPFVSHLLWLSPKVLSKSLISILDRVLSFTPFLISDHDYQKDNSSECLAVHLF